MAPEAITSPDRVDARADLYALGAVGYFLLTGQDVFTGATVLEVCSHHLHSQPVPPGQRAGRPVPDDLADDHPVVPGQGSRPSARPTRAPWLRRWPAAAIGSAWDEEQARDWWQRHGRDLRTGARIDRCIRQRLCAGRAVDHRPASAQAEPPAPAASPLARARARARRN